MRNPLGSFGIADERGHLMPATHDRREDCRPDVPRSPCEKYPHWREWPIVPSDVPDAPARQTCGSDHNSRVQRDTLIDFFHDLIEIRGDFLVYDDGYRRRRHTYADVGRAARGFAAKLSAAGMSKGDKVIVWGENRPEWIACYWGCLLNGIIVVPIDYRSSAEFVGRVRTLVDARVMVIGEEVQNQTGSGFDTDPENQTRSGFAVWKLADLDWQADGPMPAVPISRDDLIQIIFTSGATAEPKGVTIRHRNVMANVVPVEREVLKYRRYARPFHPLRFVNLLPLSHMFGQSMATNIPPMVRGTVIFTRSFNPHDILRLIRSRRVSVLVCVPKILDVLRDHVSRAFPEANEAATGRHLDSSPMVAISPNPSCARPEVLGVRRRCRAASTGPRGVLAANGLCRHPGLRPH